MLIDNLIGSGLHKSRRHNNSKGALSNNDRYVYDEASSMNQRSDFHSQMRPTLHQVHDSIPKFDLYKIEQANYQTNPNSYMNHQDSLIISSIDPDSFDISHDTCSRQQARF